MTKPLSSLLVTGKIGSRVHQRVAPGLGNISNGGKFDLQDRAHVIPFDPQSPAQLARRAAFAAAVAGWHTLTQEQKSYWAQQGKPRNLPAFNAFLSHTLKG